MASTLLQPKEIRNVLGPLAVMKPTTAVSYPATVTATGYVTNEAVINVTPYLATNELRFRTGGSSGKRSALVAPGMALPGEYANKAGLHQASAFKTSEVLTRSMRCALDGGEAGAVVGNFSEPKKGETTVSWRVELKVKGWQRTVIVCSTAPRVAFKVPSAAEKTITVRAWLINAKGEWSLPSDWVKLDPAAEGTLAPPGGGPL